MNPDHRSVGRQHPVLLIEKLGHGRASLRDRRDTIGVVGVHQTPPEVGVIDEALRRMPGDPLDLWGSELHTDDPVFAANIGVDGPGDLFDQAPRSRLGLTELLLGADIGRDVSDRYEPRWLSAEPDRHR